MPKPTPEDIQRAQAFVLGKWRERAAERGTTSPSDLSGACKFAAAFARGVFGGEIAAHDLHTWVVIDGEVLDLCRGSDDVREMEEGRIPRSQADYARTFRVSLPPGGLYAADADFMRLAGFRDAFAANAPRVDAWLREFRGLTKRPAN